MSAAPISIDRLITSAQMVSGNFAPFDAGLRSRLERLLDSISGKPLDPRQCAAIELQLRKLLATRLALAADRARLPLIADEPIERPIFVIGFARTGTTLLHSLLAEDAGARAPLWWHTHAPCPPPGEGPVTAGRIAGAARELDRLLDKAPGLLNLHPYWDKCGFAPIEDEEIFTLDLHHSYPTLLHELPSLGIVPDAADVSAAYGFHRKFLQHLQWRDRPARWVAKGIFHQFALKQLFETYPDALCIWPHREPAQVWPSMLAIAAVLYGAITDWAMDFSQIGPGFVANIAAMVRRMLDDPLVEDPRIVHVGFEELSRDPVACITRAYDHWGLLLTPGFAAAMRSWLADPANRSDRYGRYTYEAGRFGITPGELDRAFADYRRRFALAAG